MFEGFHLFSNLENYHSFVIIIIIVITFIVSIDSSQQDSANGVTLAMGQYGGGGAPLTINGEVKSKLPMTIQKTEYGGM